MKMITTCDEDEMGKAVLEDALNDAYLAGAEAEPTRVPDAEKLWEDLMKLLEIDI